MRRIEVADQVLFSRGQEIRRLLSPISKLRDGPAYKLYPSRRREVVFAAHDGSPPTPHFNEWRFATTHNGFRAAYYEKWFNETANLYYLDRAYLHIYRTDLIKQREEEFLLLHCDPNEPDDANHSLYKRGPHLHISIAEQPIPHSHIALCLSNLEDVLDSVETLMKALEWSILMIQEQFLETMQK